MYRFSQLFSLILVGGVLFAEATTTAPTTTNTTTENVAAVPVTQEEAKLIGEFELRPSWVSKAGEIHTENTAALGYQFNKTTQLDFTQYFLTNTINPNSDVSGLKLRADDAMVRLKVDEVVKNNDATVGLQSRVYLPTESTKRDAGLLFFWRNSAAVAQKLNNAVSVDFTIAPYFHVYNRSGHTVNDEAKANPWFQQRFILNADVSFTDKVTLSVPVIFDATRTRNYSANAANNDAWGYVLWAWPELAYQITDSFKLGTAWYSDNFMKSDASAFSVADGFEKGTFQVFVNYSL